MTKIPTICSSWGGCGNLINNILHTDVEYKQIVEYYKKINTDTSWTDQEWAIGPRVYFDNVVHNWQPGSIFCGWRSSANTSFHYILKNPRINHLTGTVLEKHRAIVNNNRRLENHFRRTEYWQMEHLLSDMDALYEKCAQVNPAIEREHAEEIVGLWKEKTLEFYKKNKTQVLRTFRKVVVNYDTEEFSRLLDN